MRGLKTLLGTTALLAGLALAPAAHAQLVIGVGVQPVCAYGYYGYAPYQCAPMGYYGSGYFYNGIFLGMGPWGGWGYSHGWGSHRFVNEGGGRYHGGPGAASYRGNGGHARGESTRGNYAANGNGGRGEATVSHSGGARPTPGRAQARPTNTSHATASHASQSHASASRGGGNGGHAEEQSHGGGERK